MSARDRILARLRQRTDGQLVPPPSDFSVMTGRAWTPSERLARFEQLMTTAHARVVHTSMDAWTSALREVLHETGVKRLALGRDHEVARQAREALSGSDIALVDADRAVESWQAELFHRVDAGLTSCRGAIAETGSLWLWPTPDEPRLLSLVPPLHLAILDAATLEDTFFEVVERHGWTERMPGNALLISGPSKTADIAQVLAYGVHGPRDLVVLVRH
ncbi:lactate utilization protein C [Halomonas sp. 18H]|uniref:LutC/YkgG family protein n=1 Tax=Halomonas almeriensis TaxID=308163 RepID=UPI0022329DAF|nr:MULTISPECIES: lactate utilization protein C [Halomonas]MCW4152934.1 lactate utilization protein C [Halomonas sp. 18H]MDN3553138.1 lactate utilization protein C [Halomonas almeriensis]